MSESFNLKAARRNLSTEHCLKNAISDRCRMLYVFPEPLPLARARGLQVAHFVRALAMQGVSVTLAYVPGVNGHPFSPIGYEVPANVTLLPLSRNLWGTRIKSSRIFMWRLARWLRRQEKSGSSPTIVFFRHVKAAAQFAKAFPRIPFLYEAHEVFAHTAKVSQRRRLHRLESLTLDRAALIVANSRGSADGLRDTFQMQKPICVLPNAVDYRESLPEKPWYESRLHLIYAGSLFGWKGVDDLVDAMQFLPGYHLTVIGGSPEQIDRLKIRWSESGTRISFLGHLPQHEVQSLLARSCVAILPNRADTDSAFTSPLKLFEYMAAGCAVVASDLPALRESLGSDGGSWATANDPASLAQAIRQVCERPDGGAGLGELSRRRVREFTWENRAKMLIGLLGLIGDSGGGG